MTVGEPGSIAIMANEAWKYVIVWEFHVRSGSEAQFEQIYGPGGDWVRLFRRAEGYVTTELIRGRDNPRRYLTIDLWRSHQEYESFRDAHAADYRRIDEICEHLTEREKLLGEFERAEAGV